MTPPPTQLIGSALSLIKELGSLDVNFPALDPTAPAVVESSLAHRSGIDPEIDLVSIQGAWLHLHLTLQAAREHLVGGLYLLGSNSGRTFLNPVQALARNAMEASSVSFWLCSNTITWDERLRRFSQLYLKATRDCLQAIGVDPRNAPEPSAVDKDIVLSIKDCHKLIEWVRDRGWTCRKGRQHGKEPTIRTWVREVPAYSEMMNEASLVVGLPPENLRRLYSACSTSVHSNPVTVIGGSSGAELVRLATAHSSIATAVALYGMVCRHFASWCGLPFPDGALRDFIAIRWEGDAPLP